MVTALIVSLRRLHSTVAAAPPKKFATGLCESEAVAPGLLALADKPVANFSGGRWRSRRRVLLPKAG
jgi:hypothetical protein